MANYTKATNFTAKDSLPSGNSGKIVKGAELDTEFNAIASAISSKTDSNSPAFTGTPTAPTAPSITDSTQIATTAFVNTAVTNERTATVTITNKTLTSPTINGGTISGITDLAVADGGTGASSFTANSLLLGNGTSAFQTVAPSTNGNVLTSNGTTWVSQVPPFGSVSSVATGNGLQGGTITTTGTLSIAAPGFNTVGSYAFVRAGGGGVQNTVVTSGGNISAGSGVNQVQSSSALVTVNSSVESNNLSGTWRWMGSTISALTTNDNAYAIACRIS